MIKKLKINYKDKRGFILDIFVKKNINHCTIVSFNKNSIRGNHYHKKSFQYSFILDGKFLFKEKKITNKKNGPKSKIKSNLLNKNNYIEHKPFNAHAFKCLSNSGKMIAFSKGLRGGKDYEKDTFRLRDKLI